MGVRRNDQADRTAEPCRGEVALCFVVPVKHPESSGSYRRTLDLLGTTLNSVTRQVRDSYRVVVVLTGAARPEYTHPAVSYVQTDFPPPQEPRTEAERDRIVYEDKGSRVAVGLAFARRFRPRYIMVVDADDFVNRRLVSHVTDNLGPSGWYFPRGLRYSSRSRKIDLVDNFWSYCGTSHILRRDLLDLSEGITARSSKSEVLAEAKLYLVSSLLGLHLHYRKHAASRGEPLRPLPFIGAVWHLDTGENVSRRASHWQRGPIWGKDVREADRLREAFGLPDERRGLVDEYVLRWRQGRNLAGRLVRSVLGRRPDGEEEP